jgi:hypothetical protein
MALFSALALVLVCCGARKVLVSRGTTVPQRLQVMGADQLFEYFKVRTEKGYKDGSSLVASVVMVDMAYLKASGQTLEATPEEKEALARQKRFEVHLEYRTPMIVGGDVTDEASGMSMDRWSVQLADSRGTSIEPVERSFEPPLLKKEATDPEDSFESTSKLILTYILKGNLIFEYRIPEGCKWVELRFSPPQTGHGVTTRWNIAN